MKPFLHTEGLAVGYNGRPLLEEVCLAVRRGEILTLIGPNGTPSGECRRGSWPSGWRW